MAIFKLKKNNTCNCSNNVETKSEVIIENNGGSDSEVITEKKNVSDNILTIKILGSGCKSCITLAENVKTALEQSKIDANIEKVTDFEEIAGYGVMSTPAIVINEKVVSYGKVLKPKEVVKVLEKL